MNTPPTVVRAGVIGVDELAVLLDDYRRHYGQPSDRAAGRTWLETGLETSTLHGFLARDGDTPVGMAIAVRTPATLRLGHVWQLRDLYVDGAHRGRGVGRALVAAVRDAAEADGALRVALTTEADNDPALGLYSSVGFEPVRGYVALSLDLPAPRRRP